MLGSLAPLAPVSTLQTALPRDCLLNVNRSGPLTGAALRAWIDVRGSEAGPIFVNFDRAGKGLRLSGTSLYRIVRELGEKASVKARPHGLRHAAITEALDQTNGNVRAVRAFSRHSKIETVMAYDDNRSDMGGAIATLIAEAAAA